MKLFNCHANHVQTLIILINAFNLKHFNIPPVIRLQQKLWTAHQRRPNEWQYRQQNVASNGLAGRQRSGAPPPGHHRSYHGEEANNNLFFLFFFLKLKLSSPHQLLTDGIYVLMCSFPTHKAINTVTWGTTCVQSASSNDHLCLSPQASLRTKGTGLGIKGSSYELSASDTYKDAVRKAMFSRFTEIEWTGKGQVIRTITFVADWSYCEKAPSFPPTDCAVLYFPSFLMYKKCSFVYKPTHILSSEVFSVEWTCKYCTVFIHQIVWTCWGFVFVKNQKNKRDNYIRPLCSTLSAISPFCLYRKHLVMTRIANFVIASLLGCIPYGSKIDIN